MNERRERIAVVGAGLMGTSIALDWARAGVRRDDLRQRPGPSSTVACRRTRRSGRRSSRPAS